jgi:hypothetical protein
MNIKRKLLIINANICFHKEALMHKVIPNYAKVKVAVNTAPAIKTQILAAHIRITN